MTAAVEAVERVRALVADATRWPCDQTLQQWWKFHADVMEAVGGSIPAAPAPTPKEPAVKP